MSGGSIRQGVGFALNDERRSWAWGAPAATQQSIRVLHVVSHPIQYFVPLYRALHLRKDLDLTVAFYSNVGVRHAVDPGFTRSIKWDVDLVTGYRHWFLAGSQKAPVPSRFSARQQWELFQSLARKQFDVMWLHGYNSPNAWWLTAVASSLRIPVLLREEATLLDRRPRAVLAVKAIALPMLLEKASGLFIGTENRRFFERYGANRARLSFAPYSVDNAFFQSKASSLLPKKAALKGEFGLNPSFPVVLFCGKLIAKKDPWTLIRAFGDLRSRIDAALLVVGDGPMRDAIAGYVHSRRIPDVYFAGFLNQSEIARAYAAADLLVLPSSERETWGLVVNEAMNFGLPIIVSDRVGCAADLVHDGVNGTVFSAGSVDALARAILYVLSDGQRRRRFGQASRQAIDGWSIARTADGIAEAAVKAAQAH